MAKALMKYETIDDAQVKNIMEGRESGAPEDWDDDVVEPDSSDGGSAPAESDEAAGTIGGPAQEL